MAFIRTFCFYFSLRLGSIIIGFFYLLQCVIGLIMCFMKLNNSETISENVDELLTHDLLFATSFITSIKDNPTLYIIFSIGFFSAFFCTILIMIYGVYKLKIVLVIPFLLICFIYITLLLVLYIITMLILRKSGFGLGDLIMYSIVGEFIFLYLYYTWSCVVNFCLIVKELRQKVQNLRILSAANDKYGMYLKGY